MKNNSLLFYPLFPYSSENYLHISKIRWYRFLKSLLGLIGNTVLAVTDEDLASLPNPSAILLMPLLCQTNTDNCIYILETRQTRHSARMCCYK